MVTETLIRLKVLLNVEVDPRKHNLAEDSILGGSKYESKTGIFDLDQRAEAIKMRIRDINEVGAGLVQHEDTELKQA